MLLCSSVAGICKKNVCPTWLAVTFGVFSRDNNDPLTIQPMNPVVELQWKVAVEPKIALTDVGLVIKPKQMNNKHFKSQCIQQSHNCIMTQSKDAIETIKL